MHFSLEKSGFPLGKGDFPLEKLTISPRKGRVSLLKTATHSETIYMESRAFRDILADFLEEKDNNSPLKTTPKSHFSPEPTPLLHWENRNLTQKPGRYPKTATPKTRPETPPPSKEILISIDQLTTVEQVRFQALRHLGAEELADGISLVRLKKAHRRLAKALHPDRLDGGLSAVEKERRGSQFLLLQEAYEGLKKALERLSHAISDSTRDSESASAEASRRPNAA